MRVAHLCFSDAIGGAAIAAYRIHKAMFDLGFDSTMVVCFKLSNDDSVIHPQSTFFAIRQRIKIVIERTIVKFLYPKNEVKRSLNIFPNPAMFKLLDNNFDVIHIHWIGNETISLKELTQLDAQLVWTFHDMWMLLASNHIPVRENNDSETLGVVRKKLRFAFENRLDGLKMLIWHSEPIIVAPSCWMREQLASSRFAKFAAAKVIPNPCPDPFLSADIQRAEVRTSLGVPQNEMMLMFGTFGEGGAYHKGADLLLKALAIINKSTDTPSLSVITFGMPPFQVDSLAFEKVQFLFHETIPPIEFFKFLGASDITVVPSLIDNFPNVALESLSVGTPLVGFSSSGGIAEMIEQGVNGWLARVTSPESLAGAINDAISHLGCGVYRDQIRARTLERYGKDLIAERYKNLYRKNIRLSDD